jgi:hypothetical protein
LILAEEKELPGRAEWCQKTPSVFKGTSGSNPLSTGESVLDSAQPYNRLRTPRLGGGLRVNWDVRRGRAGREPVLLGPLFSVGH